MSEVTIWKRGDEMKPHVSDMTDALRLTFMKNEEYAKTLCGPRTRGSTTEKPMFGYQTIEGEVSSVFQCVPNRKITEIAPEDLPAGAYTEGCRYFQCEIKGLGGIQRAIALEHALHAGLVVKLNHGEHGYELIAHTVPSEFESHTDTISFVVGPAGELWTWYPGEFLGSCDHGVNDMTGVKIIG